MELLSASLLIVYLGRDLSAAILYCFSCRFGVTTLSISFQFRILWFSKCRCLCHLACVKFTLHAVLVSPIALVSSCFLSCGTLVSRRCYVECCVCQVQVLTMWSRTRDVPAIEPSISTLNLRPSGLLVHN